MDITQVILDDHHEQRRLFAALEEVPSGDTSTLKALWGRLAALLELHAEAEERLFYPALLRLGVAEGDDEPKSETEDAIHDHNEIRDAVSAVAAQAVGSKAWHQAVAEANKANGDHMAEEEREGLTQFRQHVALQERHELALAFLGFEGDHPDGVEPVDKDPEKFIRENTPPSPAPQ